jgi:hypothetical protein
MSLYSTSGPRPVALTPFPAGAQAGKALGDQVAPASGKLAAPLLKVDPTTFQDDDIVSLSSQAMQAGGGLAKSTSDSAQSFMETFAKRLFGDDAGIAKVAYNMTSFKSSTSLSSASLEANGTEGSVRASAFDLSQSASFTGTGQITTDDGRIFDFELSVKYEARVQASSAEMFNKRPTLESPDVMVLTGKPLPAIKFPGGLDDLFKLLSRELRTTVSGGEGKSGSENSGDLTLRLMRLVDQAALLAPRVRPDDPEVTPLERNKALANSYTSAPEPGKLSAA